MTRRRILNVTSEKKRDKMLASSQDKPDPTTAVYGLGGLSLQLDSDPVVPRFAATLWNATARTNSKPGGAGNKFDLGTRTSTNVYLRGLHEKFEIRSTNGEAFMYRRILFHMKGDSLNQPSPLASPSLVDLYRYQDATGYTRHSTFVAGPTIDANNAPYFNSLLGLIFQGSGGVDWNQISVAKLDTNRITPVYDKTFTLQSRNDYGFIQRKTFWHPVNKTLVYNDEESGATVTPGVYSTTGRAGCGDLYVLDMVFASTAAEAGSQISFVPESTLYWHER